MVFQLGSALLDACVLAVLDSQDAYGYVLTQSVKQVMDISESTLYPVLRRLQRMGCFQHMISPSPEDSGAITRLRTQDAIS